MLDCIRVKYTLIRHPESNAYQRYMRSIGHCIPEVYEINTSDAMYTVCHDKQSNRTKFNLCCWYNPERLKSCHVKLI